MAVHTFLAARHSRNRNKRNSATTGTSATSATSVTGTSGATGITVTAGPNYRIDRNDQPDRYRPSRSPQTLYNAMSCIVSDHRHTQNYKGSKQWLKTKAQNNGSQTNKQWQKKVPQERSLSANSNPDRTKSGRCQQS